MHYILISIISFLLTIISVPRIIVFARQVKFLDVPAGDALKIHRNPIPTLGGAAILISVLVSLLLGTIFSELAWVETSWLILAISVVFTIGLFDDLKNVNPWKRLAGQLVAVLIILLLNNYIVKAFPNLFVSMGITALYILLSINAMNLIDGIDGLATGITLVASVGFLFGFIQTGQSSGIILSAGLIGTSAGFLIFNFNPAKIFLGDNGSTVLGFLLGIMAVIYTAQPYSISHVMFPVFVLIVPFAEVALTIFRRFKNRRHLFQGDRNHFYDYLIKKGLTQKQTTVLLCSFGLLGAIVGLNLI